MEISPLANNVFGQLPSSAHHECAVQLLARDETTTAISDAFSDYEMAQALQAEFHAASAQKKVVENELAQIEQDLQNAETKLAACGAAGTISEHELTQLTQNVHAFSTALERENALRFDAQNAFTALANAQINRDSAEHFSVWLASANDDDFFWNYLSTTAKLAQAHQHELARWQEHLAHTEMLQRVNAKEKRESFRHLGLSITLLIFSFLLFAGLALLAYAILPLVLCVSWAAYGCYRYRQAHTFQQTTSAQLSVLGEEIRRAENQLREKIAAQYAKFTALAEELTTPKETLIATLEKFTPLREQFLFWQNSHQRLSTLTTQKSHYFLALQKILQTYNFGNWENFDLPRLDYYVNELQQGLSRRQQVELWRHAYAKLTAQLQATDKLINELSTQITQLKLKVSIVAT